MKHLSLKEATVLAAEWKLGGLSEELKKTLIATILCVVYIREKYAARKEEWELIIDKATTWLDNQLKERTQECIQIAQKLM